MRCIIYEEPSRRYFAARRIIARTKFIISFTYSQYANLYNRQHFRRRFESLIRNTGRGPLMEVGDCGLSKARTKNRGRAREIVNSMHNSQLHAALPTITKHVIPGPTSNDGGITGHLQRGQKKCVIRSSSFSFFPPNI